MLSGVPGPDRPEGRAVLEETVTALRRTRGVRETLSFLDHPDPLFVGRGGGTFVLLGLDPGAGRVDRLVPELRAALRGLEPRLRRSAPFLSLRLTGEGPINYDIWRTSADDVKRAERRTLPVTLALLLLAFGAVVAAVLPVVSGVLAVLLTLGLVARLAEQLPLSILVVNVTSMLGLALGIDYALLSVSRFREARALGQDPRAAAADAARHAGATIALSGLPVAIGFLALLLVPLHELRSAAIGGLLVTVVSVLLAVTLLPLLLAWLGPRIEAGRLWRRDALAQRGRYARLGGWRRTATAAGAGRGPAAAAAARSREPSAVAHDPARELVAGRDRVGAGRARSRGHGARRGVLHTLRAVVLLPEDVQALSREGWEASRRLAEALAADPRIAAVRSLRSQLGGRATGDTPERELAAVALAPPSAKRTFLAEEGDAFLLEILPREELDGQQQIALVRDLRRADGRRAWPASPGCGSRSGACPPSTRTTKRPWPGASRACRGGRARDARGALRGLPLAAGAAQGRAAQPALGRGRLRRAGAGVPGRPRGALARPRGAGRRRLSDRAGARVLLRVRPSMDYEVFLVARVREERRAGRSESDAIVEGVARTGPVITNAAAVMIAVFASFMLGDFVLMKMLGFALSVAVLLDATLIRLVIGPALLQLAGRYNWWPGEPVTRR